MEFFEQCCPKYFGKYKSFSHWFKGTKPNRDVCDYYDENKIEFQKINENKSTDIHLQQIAEQMYDLYNEIEAVELKSGEWHLPFKSKIDYWKLGEATSNYYIKDNPSEVVNIPKWELKISTALLSNPTETDYQKLIEIHDQLVKDNELDTFVHCARVMSDEEYNSLIRGKISYIDNIDYITLNEDNSSNDILGWSDNYKGFISYKNIIENEIK